MGVHPHYRPVVLEDSSTGKRFLARSGVLIDLDRR